MGISPKNWLVVALHLFGALEHISTLILVNLVTCSNLFIFNSISTKRPFLHFPSLWSMSLTSLNRKERSTCIGLLQSTSVVCARYVANKTKTRYGLYQGPLNYSGRYTQRENYNHALNQEIFKTLLIRISQQVYKTYHAQKRPKICTCYRISEAKFYLY